MGVGERVGVDKEGSLLLDIQGNKDYERRSLLQVEWISKETMIKGAKLYCRQKIIKNDVATGEVSCIPVPKKNYLYLMNLILFILWIYKWTKTKKSFPRDPLAQKKTWAYDEMRVTGLSDFFQKMFTEKKKCQKWWDKTGSYWQNLWYVFQERNGRGAERGRWVEDAISASSSKEKRRLPKP